jgi:hypothetical protein
LTLLLDTHVLLWFLAGDPRLSSRARTEIEDLANKRLFSIASAWEIAIKVSLGKLTPSAPFRQIIPGLLHANNTALVVVEVSGQAGSWEENRRVELTARTAEGELLRRASDLNVLSARGRTYVAFWLYDVGCRPVRLQARLLGQRQASTRTDEIPVECGE